MAAKITEKLFKSKKKRDSGRSMMWNLKTETPLKQEDFIPIGAVLRSLPVDQDSFFTVDTVCLPLDVNFIQAAHTAKKKWLVEINFALPYSFKHKCKKGKKVTVRRDWTQYSMKTSNLKKAVRIFGELLCEEKLPDLKKWKVINKDIFLETKRKNKKDKKPKEIK